MRLMSGSIVKTRVTQGHAANAQTCNELAEQRRKQPGNARTKRNKNARKCTLCMEVWVKHGYGKDKLKTPQKKKGMKARGSAAQTRLMKGHAANARKCN